MLAVDPSVTVDEFTAKCRKLWLSGQLPERIVVSDELYDLLEEAFDKNQEVFGEVAGLFSFRGCPIWSRSQVAFHRPCQTCAEITNYLKSKLLPEGG